MLFKKRIKRSSDRPLRWRKACPLCIRRIAHQCQYTLFTDLGKTLQIDGISEYRCVIHLEISGMHNNSCRGINGQCCSIHDTVIRLNKFNTELSENNRLSELHNLTFRCSQKLMLFELVFNDSHCQLRRINRNINILQDIGKCPDMILMSVSNHKALHLINVIL